MPWGQAARRFAAEEQGKIVVAPEEKRLAPQSLGAVCAMA
jgi:hypothetical protein